MLCGNVRPVVCELRYQCPFYEKLVDLDGKGFL